MNVCGFVMIWLNFCWFNFSHVFMLRNLWLCFVSFCFYFLVLIFIFNFLILCFPDPIWTLCFWHEIEKKNRVFLSLSFCLIGKHAGKVFLQKNISFCLCLVSKKHEETKRKRILWFFGCLVVERMGFFWVWNYGKCHIWGFLFLFLSLFLSYQTRYWVWQIFLLFLLYSWEDINLSKVDDRTLFMGWLLIFL